MQANKKMDERARLWTPARAVLTAVVLSLVASFGVSSCNSSDEKRPDAPPVNTANNNSAPATGKPAAPPTVITTLPAAVVEAELSAVSGGPIKLSNYAGKVLLVNLWATWCGPCRRETPELVKLYNEFRTQGLEVVGLSTEVREETVDAVKRFVQDHNVNYRVGWATPEVYITLMQGRDAIPQTFVISRSGNVLKRFIGFNPNTTPPMIRETIVEALKEKVNGS